MSLPFTKEMGAGAAAALLAALAAFGGETGKAAAPGPLPRVAPREGPAEVARVDVPVREPRLLSGTYEAQAGRDPFATTDIWEEATPEALPLPPELQAGRALPGLTLGAGRVRAPRPVRIPALPAPVAEDGGGQ